ncbi:MAG: hypothetical protein A2275_05650 [Bacteroidetes bacterium RIFOXYA12_FULL_35_11]|nr:MAG: hypothetical protein A2X01_10810 [Bacteroidetes bacterium GWF2_35_48]OFY74966.1 MAG: hypothetical protein A2275_05650 [Bacteroidetes bacterium RIFOXYA12_FULL_35_11]OFY96942.1 MAG: hypothetical protein A2309_09590 [Bacteroidetes bacterium RIFOXYB2_FULL_35_7]
MVSLSTNAQTQMAKDTLAINNVKAINWVSNKMFRGATDSGYEVPVGSGKHSLFSHSLWIGGLDDNDSLHLSAHRYLMTGQDFYPGPLTLNYGSTTSDVSNSFNRLWKLKKTEVEEFQYRWSNGLLGFPYVIPEAITNWPAHGPAGGYSADLAPFFDFNNDGSYNIIDGDFPLIKGDEMLWWVFNDNTNVHTETGGNPLKLEIHCSAYAYNCDTLTSSDNLVLNNTTFLEYKIYNRSSANYHNTFLGLFTDGDLGYGNDDFIGFNLKNNSYFFYNGYATDGSGQPSAYGTNPPAISVTLLNSAIRKQANGIDDLTSWDNNGNLSCTNGYRYDSVSGQYQNVGAGDVLNGNINGFNYGDGIIDNECMGFTRFMYLNNGSCNDACDPITPPQYYNYLQGKWKNGNLLTYGLHGLTNPGTTARFAFPGISDPCNYGTGGIIHPPVITPSLGWSEKGENRIPNDRRGVASIGPFDLYSGQEISVELAFVWSRTTPEANVLDKLNQDIETIRQWYKTNSFPSCEHYNSINAPLLATGEIKLFPNPTQKSITIQGSWADKETKFQIFDLRGVQLCSGSLVLNSEDINLSYLQAGVYFIKITNSKTTSTIKFIKNN